MIHGYMNDEGDESLRTTRWS